MTRLLVRIAVVGRVTTLRLAVVVAVVSVGVDRIYFCRLC